MGAILPPCWYNETRKENEVNDNKRENQNIDS